MQQERTLLNRYVRYIYRKMKQIHGVCETRERALRIFAITTPERARLRKVDADSIKTFKTGFVDSILSLANEWGIPTKFLNVSLSVISTPAQLEQTLLDLTPIRVRIRKLTPTECLRLMDVSEEDIDTMKDSGLSNSALYKLAGNSIVCACLEGIFTNLFKVEQDTLF